MRRWSLKRFLRRWAIYQESEIINLLLAVFALVIVINMLKSTDVPVPSAVLAGFFLLVGGYVFTVVEGFALRGLFNTLEHLCYALAGIFFAAGCHSIIKKQGSAEDASL
jgi:hypothetical protein